MPLMPGATRIGAKQIVVAIVSAAALVSIQPLLAKDTNHRAKMAEAKTSEVKPAVAESPAAVVPDSAKPEAPEAKREPDWPKVLPDASADVEAKPDVWSEDEITEAKAYCDKVLRGVEAVLEPAEPIKQGDCGAPAPVKLISIGSSPEVELSPPVTVTCDMVIKLADWIKNDLQDLAKTHLGAPVIRMSTMSSYSCRNAYGRKKTRLSEHGRANAVDVGSFTTSTGMEVDLLAGWGMTARDVKAVIAAAKAAAEKAAAEKAAAVKAAAAEQAGASKLTTMKASGVVITKAPEPKAPAKAAADTSAWNVRLEAKAGDRAPTSRKTGGTAGRKADKQDFTVASHLGGPDAGLTGAAAAGPDPNDRASQFLRAAHSSACRRFGTVLGPEANEAHRNHFHLDMAERKRSNYCE